MSARAALAADGFVRFDGAETLALLGAEAAADWSAFADSWNDLPLDGFMADGGRYRLVTIRRPAPTPAANPTATPR